MGDEGVVIGVVGHQHHVCEEKMRLGQGGAGQGRVSMGGVEAWLTQKLWFLIGEDLVVDVIVSLSLELEDDTGLL